MPEVVQRCHVSQGHAAVELNFFAAPVLVHGVHHRSVSVDGAERILSEAGTGQRRQNVPADWEEDGRGDSKQCVFGGTTVRLVTVICGAKGGGSHNVVRLESEITQSFGALCLDVFAEEVEAH